MRAVIFLAMLAALAAQAQTPPAAFPARNVPATFHGTVVDDPYRDLEDIKNPDVLAWAKSQADYARSQLESIAGYKELRARLAQLDDSRAAVIGGVLRDGKGNLFFTRRGAKDNTFKLYRRDANAAETLLIDPDDWQKQTGKPHAINYFSPSPNGELVAFGISAAGSEEAAIYVMETTTRKRIGEPISRAQYPRISWRPDSRSFFYLREQEMKPEMPATQKYQYERSYLHVVGTPETSDVEVAGAALTSRMEVQPAYIPWVFALPGSRFAVALVENGDQREVALYTAPLVTVGKPGTPWVKVCDFSDKVTDWTVHGDDIYLMTYRDSTRFSVVRTSLSAPDLAKASTVLPASDRVLVRIAAAKDALYLEARDGSVKRLMRRPWGARASDVPLPLEGAVGIMAGRADVDGAIFGLAAWTRAREIYAVDRAGKVTNTGLQPLGPFDAPTGLVTTEVKVKSHDGAMVPLSIIHRADVKLDGSNPTLLSGYASYGFTAEPNYQQMGLAWLERGGVYAVANPRGSSVYGYDWYKAGQKTNKANTWKDFIACAEYLIAQQYTSNKKLGIIGGSAGGILVGRAMTDRPDLFAVVVPVVGVLDAVRAETTANGVPNIPEFGTVTKEDEFRGLLAMSSYHHVKEGTPYPAVLLIHGMNDPRVAFWEPAKWAAKLRALKTDDHLLLLKTDLGSGHFGPSGRYEHLKETAFHFAFILHVLGAAVS